VQPYCSKLRQSDALNVINSLNNNDLFAVPTNPFIRSFISAVRRAAKMEEPAGLGGFSGAPTPARMSKRTRENTTVRSEQPVQPQFIEDDLLAEVVSKGARKSYAGATAKQGAAAVAPRVVTEDGWFVKPGTAAPKPSQTSQRGGKRGGVNSGTQLSSLVNDLDDNEVFIATQEFA
jgi:hypothetical protein